MKKVLSSLAVCAMVFIVSATLDSCKKDDSKSSLDGTTWVSQMADEEALTDYVLAFQKKTFSIEMSMASQPNMSITIKGTYTYDDPDVELTMQTEERAEKLSGVREGNKITFVDGRDTTVFTKR